MSTMPTTTARTSPARRRTRGGRLAVVSCQTLAEAEGFVDLLTRRCFPPEYVSVAAEGVRRNPALRASLPRAARTAILAGALIGAAATFAAPLGAAVEGSRRPGAILVGLLLGALIAATACLLMMGSARRKGADDLTTAERYDVLVEAEWADDARQVLGLDREERVSPAP